MVTQISEDDLGAIVNLWETLRGGPIVTCDRVEALKVDELVAEIRELRGLIVAQKLAMSATSRVLEGFVAGTEYLQILLAVEAQEATMEEALAVIGVPR